jgi:hypothetical protein
MKKICINYYGQVRNVNITRNTYNKFIKDNNEYHIIFTTWNNENTKDFELLFPSSYIKKIETPKMDDYSVYVNNIVVDKTNNHKNIEHIIYGLYIKKMSYDTIDEYENINNINFDFIISLRTDVYLNRNLNVFYGCIDNFLNNNVVFVAAEPKFQAYNEPALPDVLCISNKVVMKKMLSQLDSLDKCLLANSNQFHPETSFLKYINFLDLKYYELQLRAFPQPI